MQTHQYLLTWYGVTDYRSALGLNDGPGPILLSLRHRDFTHVRILAYRNKEREADIQGKKEKLQESLQNIAQLSAEEKEDLLKATLNTSLAEQHMQTWLKQQCAGLGKTVQIDIIVCELNKLNDTENIYDGVRQALHDIGNDEQVGKVTLYISPGTPVMAFSSAFAALGNVRLNLGLMSSSIEGEPPADIEIPEEWLRRRCQQSPRLQQAEAEREFDIILHLLRRGEQRVPILQCMRLFPEAKHIFVQDKEMSVQCFEPFLAEGEKVEKIDITDPFNARQSWSEMHAYIRSEKVPAHAKIAINLTRGNKMMAHAAMGICQEMNCTPLYVKDKGLLYLGQDKSIPLKPITDVEDFLKLYSPDLVITRDGKIKHTNNKNIFVQNMNFDDENRKALCNEIWKRRNSFSKNKRFLSFLHEQKDTEQKDQEKANFVWSKLDIERCLDDACAIKIHRRLGSSSATLVIEDFTFHKKREFSFSAFPDLLPFLCGTWLEEYCYYQLEQLVHSGIISDLRTGLILSKVVKAEGSASKKDHASREFDLLFTDGYKLYIGECKTGTVRLEQIDKLIHTCKRFGGNQAQGILINSQGHIEPNVKEKLQASKLHWTEDIEGESFDFARWVENILNNNKWS